MKVQVLVNVAFENPVLKVYADGTDIEVIKNFIKKGYHSFIYDIYPETDEDAYEGINLVIGYDDIGEYAEDRNFYLITTEVDGI